MEMLKRRVREAGFVPTRQRMVLMQSLIGRRDHPDAMMLQSELREILPSLSADTVYRTLNSFAGKGLIQRLALPGRRARFDGNMSPHDHFYCVGCEGVLNIDVGPGGQGEDALPMEQVGRVLGVQRVYTGLCRECAAMDSYVQSLETC